MSTPVCATDSSFFFIFLYFLQRINVRGERKLSEWKESKGHLQQKEKENAFRQLN
jgi:hypothetical protein